MKKHNVTKEQHAAWCNTFHTPSHPCRRVAGPGGQTVQVGLPTDPELPQRKVLLLTQPPAGPVPTAEELAQAVDVTPFILHQDIEWTGGLEVHHPPKHQVQR